MFKIKPYALGLLPLAFLGCSDGTGPGTAPRVSLSFATRVPSQTAASAPAYEGFSSPASDTISDGANTLIITRAQLVLREIELERQEVADCDVEPEPAGCEDFETGPVLIDLPLGPGAVPQVEVDVPPGVYVEVEFDIHKVSNDDPEDAAFRQAHPDFIGKSIRVQGTFNGTAFTYETDLNVEQELDLVPPLVIADTTTTTNLTIRVDLRQWFRAPDGTLVNPATANKGGPNENLVKENIKRSIKAFEDRDKDGDEGDERD
ncbi:hypothetical protein HRbin33_01517 [bacterium HR33]|nr:hypothetical protein HRbin33_01517 [bacterium HR33]